MTRKYFYTLVYELNGVQATVKNPYLFSTEEEAFEYMGKAVQSLVLANPGVKLNLARVSYTYEEV